MRRVVMNAHDYMRVRGEVRLFPCTCCLVKVVRQDMLDGPSHPRVRAPSLAEKSDGAAYVMLPVRRPYVL